MSYRSSSPVSGFAGHVPGSKWQVGSRNVNIPNNPLRSSQSEPEPTIISDHSHTFDFEGNPVPRFSPYIFHPMTPAEYTQFYNHQMANLQQQQPNNGASSVMQQQSQQQYPNGIMQQQPVYGFNPAFSMNGGGGGFPLQNGMASSASMQGLNQSQISPGNHNINGQPPHQQQQPQQQQRNDLNEQRSQDQKSRSKSMPKKPKSEVRDMFGGIESGWWSEGQALKNIRRHQQSQASGEKSNGDFSNEKASTISRYRRRFGGGEDDDDDDVPAPGYSGHIPGIKTYGVGKPFTVAAKECRKKMHEIENSAIQAKGKASSEKGGSEQRDNQSQNQNSQTSRQQQFAPQPQGGTQVNGFQPLTTPQQSFMNSYAYMTPNGMMQQPMYMGLPMQGQPNPNINQPEF